MINQLSINDLNMIEGVMLGIIAIGLLFLALEIAVCFAIVSMKNSLNDIAKSVYGIEKNSRKEEQKSAPEDTF